MNDILKPIKDPKIFCKIDTQGYDLNVLKGALKFTKFFSIVQAEISIKPLYNNSPNFIKSFEYFDSIGFEVVQLFPCSVNKQLGHTLEYDCILVKKT